MLSLLLCLVLISSMLPFAAFAEEEDALEVIDIIEEEQELFDFSGSAEETEEPEPEAPAEPETEEPEQAEEAEEPEQPVEVILTEPIETVVELEALPDGMAADTDLLADDTWIPDENFRAALSVKLKRTSLTVGQAIGVAMLDLSYSGIEDLTGIQYFTGLTTLICNYNNLSELDVSACTRLTYLNCSNNNLSTLDISGCSKLEYLYCSYNDLDSLAVEGLQKLKFIYCQYNDLDNMDITGCETLVSLTCNNNSLGSLTTGTLSKLENISCSYNRLQALDLRTCTGLTKLYCSNNCLSSLDVGGCTKLQLLSCSDNNLVYLNIDGTSLVGFDPGYQNVSSENTLCLEQLGSLLIGDLKPVFGNINYSGMSICPAYDFEFFGDSTVTADGIFIADFSERNLEEVTWYTEASSGYPMPLVYSCGSINGTLEAAFIDSKDTAPCTAELSRSYLLLEVGETAALSFKLGGAYAKWAELFHAEIRDMTFYGAASNLTVDGDVITAVAPGTAELTVSLCLGDVQVAEFPCRVDVVESLSQDLLGISLVDTAASVKLYGTAYPRVRLLPELAEAAVTDTSAASEDATLVSAVFADESVAKYFTLRVVNDRTVEVIPTEAAIAANIKGSYSSKLIVTLKNAEPITTSEALKLTVTNTKPTLKGAAIAFNSFLQDEAYPIAITGGQVTGITVVSAPEWLVVDTEEGMVMPAEAVPSKATGKLVLDCTLADYSVTATVTISVSVASQAPTVKLADSKLSVTAGSNSGTTASVTPAACVDYPITVTRITEGSVTYANDCDGCEDCVLCPWLYVDLCPDERGFTWVDLYTGNDDGKDHTLKVYFSAGGKESVLTVKITTLQKVTLSASATGSMNSTVKWSYNDIVMKAKDFNGESWTDRGWMCFGVDGIYTKSGKEYVEYTDGGLEYESITEMYDSEGVIRVFRNTEKDLAKNTYYAKVTVYSYDEAAENGIVPGNSYYVKLKITFPSKVTAGKLTLKATAVGYYVDGLAAKIRATTSNFEDYSNITVSAAKVYDADNGKQAAEAADAWFEYDWDYASEKDARNDILSCFLQLTDEGMASVKPGDKYAFTFTCADDDGNAVLDGTGKAVTATATVTLTGGKVKVSTKGTAQLLKKDRFDSTAVAITCTGGTPDTNRAPVLDAKSARYLDASWGTDSQGNTALVLRWKDSTVANTKGGTVKVSCFMVGNNSLTKANSFSVKLTVK